MFSPKVTTLPTDFESMLKQSRWEEAGNYWGNVFHFYYYCKMPLTQTRTMELFLGSLLPTRSPLPLQFSKPPKMFNMFSTEVSKMVITTTKNLALSWSDFSQLEFQLIIILMKARKKEMRNKERKRKKGTRKKKRKVKKGRKQTEHISKWCSSPGVVLDRAVSLREAVCLLWEQLILTLENKGRQLKGHMKNSNFLF